MRRVLLAFVIGTAFVFSAAVAFANPPKGIVTMGNGTYGPADVPGGGCDAGGCVGELLTCEADEAISPISQYYYFIRGVCDDRESGGLPICS